MDNYNEINFDNSRVKEILFGYISLWPYYLIGILLSLFLCFLFLRYSENQYTASTKIEILDKAQDSEMALPTSMTIFNRSMINLQNEIGLLNSYKLNETVVSRLKSNVRFCVW